MSKFVDRLLKIMIVFLIFVGIFVYYFCGDSSGCENNITTSQEEETNQYFREFDDKSISQQKEMIDFYQKQKSLMDENETLHEIINLQAIENEEAKVRLSTIEDK